MRVVRAVDLLVLEYEQLKEEQRLRIGTRDNLLYATLGSLAVIPAATMQPGQVLLLLVSPVCLILGWTYFVNDNRITAIDRNVETVTCTALTARSEPGIPVLAWERAHRRGPGRRSRKVWQAVVDLLTFVFSTLVALAMVIASGLYRRWRWRRSWPSWAPAAFSGIRSWRSRCGRTVIQLALECRLSATVLSVGDLRLRHRPRRSIGHLVMAGVSSFRAGRQAIPAVQGLSAGSRGYMLFSNTPVVGSTSRQTARNSTGEW